MKPGEGTGLLLVNLGTPESPRAADVRPYLREFLSDPRVIDISGWRRWLVLNLFILPFRPRQSGEAYEKVWTDRGSPLLFHSRRKRRSSPHQQPRQQARLNPLQHQYNLCLRRFLQRKRNCHARLL
jgi:protoheme ferro-lyase